MVRSVEVRSPESGGSSERSTESVLRAVCLRLGCTAATAVFPREETHSVWGRSETDFAFAREQLGIVGDELARREVADVAREAQRQVHVLGLDPPRPRERARE